MVNISYNADIPESRFGTARVRYRHQASLDAIQRGRESGATNVKLACGDIQEAKRLASCLHGCRRKGEFRGLICRRGADVYVVLGADI